MEVGRKMATIMLIYGETDLCLGLPGGGGRGGHEPADECLKMTRKREFFETVDLKLNLQTKGEDDDSTLDREKKKMKLASSSSHEPIKDPIMPPLPKAEVVGWPPVKNYRKKKVGEKMKSSTEEGSSTNLVKVWMDGAPYLRKVDLKMYSSYQHLSHALANMVTSFSTIGNNGCEGIIDFMNEGKLMDLLNNSEYVPTYEDKDGDWMLVGDVPWEMFVESCNRLRIMRGSEAIGLAPRAMKICKS